LNGCTSLCARQAAQNATGVRPGAAARSDDEYGCFADCTEKCIRVCATG